MKDEKDLLVREYRKSPAFAGYHIFAPAGHIERYMEDALFKFYEAKKDDPIMAATNLFGNIINIHPFEDGDGRIFRLILAHVLIQMKCCLFPMILTLFRMGFFGAAHDGGGLLPPSLKSSTQILHDKTWHSYTLPKEDPKNV